MHQHAQGKVAMMLNVTRVNRKKIAKTASVIKEVFLEEMYFVLALEPVKK